FRRPETRLPAQGIVGEPVDLRTVRPRQVGPLIATRFGDLRPAGDPPIPGRKGLGGCKQRALLELIAAVDQAMNVAACAGKGLVYALRRIQFQRADAGESAVELLQKIT